MFKVTILALFCNFLTGSETGELKVIIERNVPVPMRDGTILRADVYRPDHGGPYPVLVHRTQYGRHNSSFNQLAKAGYIVVSQNIRGRYDSEGRYESILRPLIHDGEDGYDTVEWAAKLPGSTGKVGTFGNSHPGGRQWTLAPLRPPSLVAMQASNFFVRLPDFTQGFPIPPLWIGGGQITWAPNIRRRENLPGVQTRWEANKLWKEESEKWINWLPWLDLPYDIFANETDSLKYLLKNPHFDTLKLDEGCKDIVVPNLFIYGWFDFVRGDILLFEKLRNEAKSKVARLGSRIIVGPWLHGSTERRLGVGNIDFGPNAEMEKTAMLIRWFDYWLKGIQNGVDKDAPMRIFVMGDNIWRNGQSWPPEHTKEKIFYTVGNGNANTPNGDGGLTTEKLKTHSTDNYVYDPRSPVPSAKGSNPNHTFPSDQRRLADREDIVVYQTEPLTERIEVTGDPVVELYASSSAPDTDWFVRLIDVHPDGLALDISYGIVRARYRYGLDKSKLIEPNTVVKYAIRMRSTSNAFLPGHRIRLDVTSSDFPRWDRNHNTAANQYADSTLVTANQTIHHGGEQATRIILPWIPNTSEEKESVQAESEPVSQKQMYPLHQAVAEGDIERINLLLSEGAYINAQDQKKNTPLCRAVESGKMKVVQLLVDAGADVNSGSWPPLCVAVDENNIAIAEYLIAQGANVNANEGWTALQEAPYIDNNIEMVQLLIANGADVNAGPFTALHAAANKGRVDIAKLLVQNGANINVEDTRSMTPLEYALSENRGDIAELLLERMTDSTSKDKGGLTSLHYAAAHGFQDIIELLLDKGAKIDGRDDIYNFTPLHYVARFGNKNVAEVLIAHGADIEAKDKWDYQPIHWAAYHDRPEIIELLIAKGADANAKTSLGQTPLELAIPRRNTKTIEVLNKHSNKNTTLDKPYVVLERGDVRAVIVNNEPVDDEVLPGHRGGYSGVASLTHKKQDRNIFVQFYAGLNFEHIHDGINQPRDILFEPRRAPMQIKRIDEFTTELYQPPTPHWQLESWLRYKLLEDGVIEMMLECIPRARTFKNDYIGLFFASYIDKPESLDIHFLGRPADDSNAEPRWIRGVTPAHGTLPTHLAADDNRNFAHDPNFPLTLVFNRSNYRYTEPWYYGVSHGMALVLMFRPEDNVRLSQSPSGGGEGNPAWDFQWFVPQYKVGQRYRFVMRAMYLPFESQQQIIQATARHRAALERQEWTRFRGPNGQGISDARNIPVKWTEKDYNWKVKLPGGGHGSPVIWRDKVFLTCENPETTGGILLALNVSDGRVLWQKKYKLTPYRFHNDNSYATTTPVVDAQRVYVLWQTSSEVILAALDHEGRPVWQCDFPGIYCRFGPGTSPALFDDLIVFSHEHWAKGPEGGKHESSWIALDRETGRTRWRTKRNNAEISYSTPCIYRPDGHKPQLIFTSWAHGISGVDPHSGKVIWELDSVLPARAISSPVIAGDLLIGTCGKGGAGKQLSAVRPGSRDNPGQASLVYKCTGKTAPYVPTSLAKDGLLFTFHDQGDVSCLRSETGDVLWSERPGGMFYGSPVWVNGLLYCINRKGEVLVLKAAPNYELLAINPLGEKSQATPAIASNKMYLRTYSHLISIGGELD